ncbi:metallophosphoesterase family protein [Jidongwangia harbinensis]|uniref:metallophosphoesterase family protein n=1 Tax=Jidongwangia harbinensis TaxID=2878561 RepID=UPI001CDA4E91|nr:metallophosphoesterase [Jidongwangia harbinensis]MCA2219064.1 metallophosphoesterase [Jidongwangia harbinensis]
MNAGSLLAVSDLHVAYAENRRVVDGLRPASDEDWLIVAGDVGELFGEVVETLAALARRFAKVIWAPGNHELWTHPQDPVRTRGEHRYRELVDACRDLGVLTPEDEFAVWEGTGGPITIAPLFVLYDYSFRAPGARTKDESLRRAYDTGVVCSDEMLLHPDPYPSREAWCWARVTETERRLQAIGSHQRTVLVSHWPLVRQPTEVLRFPEFAQWCGTDRTADWHVRFRADVAVYGHLHIPRTTHYDGVRFEEVSLGYPREWRPRRGEHPRPLRTVLDVAAAVR